MELLWELVGWAGAIAILGAFLAVSMGWLKAGRRFQLANLLGACAFIVNSAFHGAWPSVATNVAWFLISVVALFRMRSIRPLPANIAQPPLPGISEPSGALPGIDVPAK
ncbi:YgjV family protein [Pseudarthrobacter sp. fls2-241-R2A-168]|uniref:CBU_0592 family membrane protein n=1 Tax=Pseudarthrobacter sp. fls2-241-R2A-168 TaxID=3040304 RepID=UPI00330585A1